MPAIDLAAVAHRYSNRPGHVRAVEQHSINLAVQQIMSIEAARKKRRYAMVRIIGSLITLLGCFSLAIGNKWILWPQATTVFVGMLAFAALFAEAKSD
jgi:hypothetical protein